MADRCKICRKAMKNCRCKLGIDYLAIPFGEVGKPDTVRPLYVGYIDKHGYNAAFYECPYCHQRFRRSPPARGHMGLTMNIPASCRVLLAQDARRRLERAVK